MAGFVAIGAYTSALLTTPDDPNRFGGFGLPIFIGWVGGAITASIASFLIGALTIRLRADYLAIATFGVAVVVQLCALNLEPLTGGPFGIGFIPRPFAEFRRHPPRLQPPQSGGPGRGCGGYVSLARTVGAQPRGRVLRAIREDEQAALALGKSSTKFRLQAFALGGGIMGLAGGCQAHFIGFIAPENYVPMLTFQVWAMLIVGGSAIIAAPSSACWYGAYGRLRPEQSRRFFRRVSSARRGLADRHDRCGALRHPAASPTGHSGRRACRFRHLGKLPRPIPSAPTAPIESSSMPARPDRIRLGEGLDISRLVCGPWQVADLEKGGTTLDPETSADALEAYARAGFDTFDMADDYGSAESITGRSLARSKETRNAPSPSPNGVRAGTR